eukprot:TRINITY_DN3819_c0_g1_i12.p1 TRINITY_DN3819_c0_g1~~TRINITY_DN3819_c0_g1_i12.p1  ORF type:complete len:708 (-),score=193.63 TRINITY_DN3819_c0_g1_i12:129-2252(-)
MDSYNLIQLPNAPIDFCEAQDSCCKHRGEAYSQSESSQNLFETFFKTARHPSFILDLNVNAQKAQPTIFNPTASSLFSSCKNFFLESQLEQFNGTFDDFIHSAKRRVAEEIRHLDLLHVFVRTESKTTETTFSLDAWSFDYGEENKMLGIVLTEITKTVKKELDAIEIFKEGLFSTLSHELNNPMNSLIPLLKMMPNYYMGEKKENLKEMALASANILHSKIRDLIDYAKIQQENIKFNFAEFYVEDLFDKLKRTFKYEMEEKSNVFTTRINTKHNKKLLIIGDHLRIEQVLVKLLSNANKYTENGTISLIAEENEKNFDVMFSVQDTGMGIPKKIKDSLFVALPHKARNIETVVKLPGLGLEIARRLCQHMGFRLSVVSEERKGSKFFFEIPVCRIELFDEVTPTTLFETIKSHEAPAMLQTNNKDIRRPLFSRDFLVSLKKPKMEKQVSRRLSLNGSSLKAFGSFQTPTNYFATQPLRRNRQHIFSQKNVLPRNANAASPSTGADWEISEEYPAVHKRIQQYIRPRHNYVFGAEEVKNSVRQLSVVIVDDAYSNRFVVREMVKAMSISTIECKDGQNAVSIVEQHFRTSHNKEIALIFMDLSMPVMNGIDATIAIRELEKRYKRSEEIPIVAVTGQDATSDRNKCFEVGMQEYVKKPITSKIVKRIIAQYAPELISQEFSACFYELCVSCCNTLISCHIVFVRKA